MSKVRTFSRVFPKGHVSEGMPTYFVEQFISSLNMPVALIPYDVRMIMDEFEYLNCGAKRHTIRFGNSIKDGETISFRVWSGKPYNSPQIKLADVQVRVLPIWIDSQKIIIRDKYYAFLGTEKYTEICQNDGLSVADFQAWFKPHLPFTGQLIIWGDVQY